MLGDPLQDLIQNSEIQKRTKVKEIKDESDGVQMANARTYRTEGWMTDGQGEYN